MPYHDPIARVASWLTEDREPSEAKHALSSEQISYLTHLTDLFYGKAGKFTFASPWQGGKTLVQKEFTDQLEKQGVTVWKPTHAPHI